MKHIHHGRDGAVPDGRAAAAHADEPSRTTATRSRRPRTRRGRRPRRRPPHGRPRARAASTFNAAAVAAPAASTSIPARRSGQPARTARSTAPAAGRPAGAPAGRARQTASSQRGNGQHYDGQAASRRSAAGRARHGQFQRSATAAALRRPAPAAAPRLPGPRGARLATRRPRPATAPILRALSTRRAPVPVRRLPQLSVRLGLPQLVLRRVPAFRLVRARLDHDYWDATACRCRHRLRVDPRRPRRPPGRHLDRQVLSVYTGIFY